MNRKPPYIEIRNTHNLDGSAVTYKGVMKGHKGIKVIYEGNNLNDCKVKAHFWRDLTGFDIIYTEARIVIESVPEAVGHD